MDDMGRSALDDDGVDGSVRDTAGTGFGTEFDVESIHLLT